MRKIIIAVLAITAGRAYAADFAGLQALKAADISVAEVEGIKAERAVSVTFQAVEVSYVQEKYGELDKLANTLLEKDGVTPETLTTAKYIEAYRRAGAEFKKINGTTAPSRDALDTVVYINGKMVQVMEALALKHPGIEEFTWQLMGPGLAMSEAVAKAGSPAEARAAADKVAVQYLGNKATVNGYEAVYPVRACLTAADGTEITVNYSVRSIEGSVTATPVRVDVAAPALAGGGKQVRVVLLNYYDNAGMPAGQIRDTQTLDLKYAGGSRYSAMAEGVALSESHIGYGYNFRQEIAVVVDGVWLKDPVNGASNFRFKMSWY